MKIIREAEWKREAYYTIDFDIDDTCGFTFPCDKYGNVEELNPSAEQNYRYCLEHPEKYRAPYVKKHIHEWREPPVGRCSCGEEVTLTNDYEGATQCPKCGQWYNLFGQALIDPEYWEDDYSDY